MIWVTAVSAQADIYNLAEPYFETVATEKEVPTAITAIIKDTQGFIWFGTQNGLVRFDGYRYKRFLHDSNDPRSLANNYVLTLWAAPNKDIWIGTFSGLSIYHPEKDSFTNSYHDELNQNSLLSDTIRSIVGDDGGMWVATTQGLNYFTAKADGSGYDSQYSTLHNQDILALAMDRNKTLWIGAVGNIYYIRPGSRDAQPAFVMKDGRSPFEGQYIFSLLTGRDGRIWAGTHQQGAYWFSPEEAYAGRSFHTVPFNKDSSLALEHPWVTSMTQPTDDEVWLATYGGGISIFDINQNRIIKKIKHNPSNPQSITLDTITSTYTDDSGLIWIGTLGRGVCRTNSINSAFRILRKNPDDPHSISGNNINAVLETSSGLILLGAGNNGVDIIDPDIGLIDGIRPVSKDIQDGLKEGTVNSMAQSDQNTVWLGTPSFGLYRYDLHTKKLTNYNKVHGLSASAIRALAADSRYLWIGTSESLQRLDIQSGKSMNIGSEEHPSVSLTIERILIAKDKTVWVATDSQLFVVPVGETKLIEIKPNPDKVGSLKGKPYFNLSIDSDYKIWVRTTAGIETLTNWNGKSATFELTRTTEAKGKFPDNFVEDDFGNFWAHQSFYEKSRHEVRLISEYDGVDIGGSVLNSNTKTKDGLVLIGGANGLLVIDPEKYQLWTYEPSVQITDIKVDNKSIAGQRNSLTLSGESNSVSVEFTALDYSGPSLIEYAYRLKGYEEDWIEVETNHGDYRLAKYANLSPGVYKLQIKATNRVGQWSSKVISIPIIKLPAWHQTIWFKVFISVLVALSGLAILNARTRFLLKRNAQLKRLVDEKTLDIRSILDAIKQGILLIENDDGRVGQEHSKYLEELVETSQIEGQNFYDLLFESSTFNADEKSQIMSAIGASVGESELGFEMSSHLLPREAKVEKKSGKHIYQLDWNPILSNSVVVKILLVVRDITELRALELESKEHRREIDIIQEIINVPSNQFTALINSCSRFIEESHSALSETQEFDSQTIQLLFRNMHTMKGLARSCHLNSLSEASHIAEQYYSDAMKSNRWDVGAMLEMLSVTESIVNEYKKVNKEKLGRTPQKIDLLSVERGTIEKHLQLLFEIETMNISNTVNERIELMRRELNGLIIISLKQILDVQVKSAESLARQLGKEEPAIVFNDPGFSINKSAHEFITYVFTHLIRNSIDHGLETSKERLEKGKTAKGTLSFDLRLVKNELQIAFYDDGKGLDLLTIRKLAKERLAIDESILTNPEYIANLIFSSGFSTAKSVTDISGRGVGMTAVKSFLEENGCSIEIRLKNPCDTNLGFAPLEFIIMLPAHFFQFIGRLS
jgi:ligand-binding sensor domain-containing protein/PAS domain-containing protein